MAGIPAEVEISAGGQIPARREFVGNLKKTFSSYQTGHKPYFKIAFNGTFGAAAKLSQESPQIFVEPTNGNLFIVKKTRGKLSPFGEIKDSKRLAEVNLEHLNPSLVFSAVRACFHYYLEKKGGFALHASCGVAGGGAYVFTGKPSAGKTTALKNLAPDRIVAQDCLAIARRNNRYMAFSLPFFGEKSEKGRVKAVFFPKRTTGSPRLERETLPETFAEISANAMFSSPQNPRLVDAALENVNRFCAEIPAFSLFSLKRTDVRKLFSEKGIL